MRLTQWTTWLLVLGMLVVANGIGSLCHAEIRTDFRMDSDPALDVPDPVKSFSPALKSLWLAALERPEADMQRLAAETIARGHEFGVPDLTEAISRLEAILISEKSHPAARFAAARALIVLDAHDSSDKLFQVSQKYEADLRQLIEPALAKWKFAPAIVAWKDRLGNTDRPRDLILALRGLAEVQEPSVTSTLLAIVHDETRSPDVRLEAATAAGQSATSGLEADAEKLAHHATKRISLYPICACRLLARHDSAAAQKVLTELTGHEVSVVVADALNRLLEIDSSLVLPLTEGALNHADPRVRRIGAAAYLQHPTPERIALLARLLADPHPNVRREVCDGFYGLSNQSPLVEAIRIGAMELLSQDSWQGQEQAALLLGMLEHQAAAGRLAELLESPRPEVGIAAAWALRKTAVQENIPAILDKARRQTARRMQVDDPSLNEQVSHLFEALGVLKADEAVPLLKQYIPKVAVMGERSRCAAIYALGLIMEGKRDVELEDAFNDRIRDFSDSKPELDSVKEKCAIALARMKAVDQGLELKQLAESAQLAIRLKVALRWAVKELTGEELSPVEPLRLPPGNWFLEPLPK